MARKSRIKYLVVDQRCNLATSRILNQNLGCVLNHCQPGNKTEIFKLNEMSNVKTYDIALPENVGSVLEK